MRLPYNFTVQELSLQASRMSAKTQLQVSRRVTPVLMGVVPALLDQMRSRVAQMQKRAGASAEESGGDTVNSLLDLDMSVVRETLLPALQNASEHLASMPDEEFDYIMHCCLSLVSMQREGGTGWVPIWNAQARQPQFEDLDGSTLLLIMVEVLKTELTPFMTGLVSSL